MPKLAESTTINIGNPIFIPAVWVVDARGGLRLASEADKEQPESHWAQNCAQSAARPSSARQNDQKRKRHASRLGKGVFGFISKGA